jgi:hypothetical protein
LKNPGNFDTQERQSEAGHLIGDLGPFVSHAHLLFLEFFQGIQHFRIFFRAENKQTPAYRYHQHFPAGKCRNLYLLYKYPP